MTPPADRGAIQRVPLLADIVASEFLRSVYQPIVDLRVEARPTIGFEALARYTDPMPLATPDLLFEYAHRKKGTIDLDLACVSRAVRQAPAPAAMLFINLQPLTLEEGSRLLVLIDALLGERPDLRGRVVFELTEHVTFTSVDRAVEHADRLRERDVRFAFDDVGSGFSHLRLLDSIRPEYIKLSNEFGTGFEESRFKRKIIEHQVALAHDFDAAVILEGIETAATAEAAAELQIELGQGWLFGRPMPASSINAD